MRTITLLVLGALAAAAAGVPAWRRWAPTSYWFALGFPIRAVRVYLTWAHVASACGLARKRRRWRWTLDAIPVMGSVTRAGVMLTRPRRRLRRVDIEHPPRLGLLRPDRLGWRARIRLHEGQVPDDYKQAAERLAHAWRVHAVRVTGSAPGRVWLRATRADPLTTVATELETGELLTCGPACWRPGSRG